MQGLRFPLARSPEASQTQLGRVKAICDLARLASGIIVVISVFNSLLTCFRLCTTWHEHTMFTYVYGTTRIRCLTHKLEHGTHTHQCIVLNKRSRIIMFDTIHYPQHLDKRHDQRHNMYNEIEPLQYNVDVI